HLGNGAVYGAVYSNVAPFVPVPRVVRGPAVALMQHLVFWPLASFADRLHPARQELPALAGHRRAFAQSTWRHLVFGVVLGELVRVLITGASGFAGGYLARACADAGDAVFGVSRSGSVPAGDGLAVDLLDAGAVRTAFRDVKPELVYPLAALSSVGRSWATP